MKKVLIITYYWPPSGGSGVQRWLKFAKFLPEYGWEPVIYTPLNPEANSIDNTLLKEVSENTLVLKRKIWEPYSIYKTLFGSKSNSNNNHIKANIIGSQNKSLSHKLSLFVRGNFFIPDPRCWWIKPSIKWLVKYLKENPVDAIVSTGPPHSMHLIAKGVKEATGIKWIADFRDPWTEIFYFKHLNLSGWALKKHKRLEQSVIDSADVVTVVSNKMKQDFAGRTSTPVEIITNGFDPDDFKPNPNGEEETLEDKGKFTLTHTGIFVDNGNPNKLWEVLGELCDKNKTFKEDLRIRLLGQVDKSVSDGIKEAGLNDNCICMGYVAHNQVTQWQQSASVLLLPLRKEPEAAAILTGKFFEYLASGREILAFGPTNGDLAKALCETKSGTIVDFEDKEGIRKEITRLYGLFKEGALKSGSTEISEHALKYSRKHLTGEICKFFD